MAAGPSPLSIQEFHRLYDGAKPAYEYWFGKAIQKSMPTILHGIVQFIIATLLEFAKDCIRPVGPSVAEARYRTQVSLT